MATEIVLPHTDSDRVRMRNEIRGQIVAKLSDKEYRDIFVSEQVNTGLSFQLRKMREARGWSQSELGKKVGMAQSRISLMEEANYSRYSLNTLRRLASVFDVALVVRFESFSELVEDFVWLDSSSLNVVDFGEDTFVAETLPSGISTTLIATYVGEASASAYLKFNEGYPRGIYADPVPAAPVSLLQVGEDHLRSPANDLAHNAIQDQWDTFVPAIANILQQSPLAKVA